MSRKEIAINDMDRYLLEQWRQEGEKNELDMERALENLHRIMREAGLEDDT